MEDIPTDTNKIYHHYGKKKDLEAIKNGEIEGVDFLIGKEEDLKKLTADMAGFGTEQSQRVIIDYDKGYGHFIVKRIPMEYGVSEAEKMNRELENWISVNLPENCSNVCISFKREIADIQIKQFKAKPLYGFNNEKEDWLPVEVFITYGGVLASEQKHGCKKSGGKMEYVDVIKRFYVCPNCGMAISGEKREYFVCPECGRALCEESKLADFDDKYCGNCGTKITSARNEALALVRKVDVRNL